MEKKSSAVQTKNSKKIEMARGQNNNNPFNIIKTEISWFGEVKGLLGFKEDKFEQFDTLEHGIRAGLLNLRNGYQKKGINTPEAIINTYAPNTDNSEASRTNYKRALAYAVHGKYNAIDKPLTNNTQWLKLAYAMQRFENGKDTFLYDTLLTVNYNEKIFI